MHSRHRRLGKPQPGMAARNSTSALRKDVAILGHQLSGYCTTLGIRQNQRTTAGSYGASKITSQFTRTLSRTQWRNQRRDPESFGTVRWQLL